MINKELTKLVNNVQQGNTFTVPIAGLEAISLGESLSFLISGFSVGYDKVMAAIFSNRSVHTVDNRGLSKAIEGMKISYTSNSGKPITIPNFFDPKTQNITEYVEHIVEGLILINTIKTDIDGFFKTLKKMASSGRMPNNPQVWKISNTFELVDKTEEFIKNLQQNKISKAALSSVYPNFGSIVLLTNKFNECASQLKQRDIEILFKELNRVKEVGDIVLTQYENGDLDFSIADKERLKELFSEFTRGINTAGAILGLANEMSAVFKTQIEEVLKMK